MFCIVLLQSNSRSGGAAMSKVTYQDSMREQMAANTTGLKAPGMQTVHWESQRANLSYSTSIVLLEFWTLCKTRQCLLTKTI